MKRSLQSKKRSHIRKWNRTMAFIFEHPPTAGSDGVLQFLGGVRVVQNDKGATDARGPQENLNVLIAVPCDDANTVSMMQSDFKHRFSRNFAPIRELTIGQPGELPRNHERGAVRMFLRLILNKRSKWIQEERWRSWSVDNGELSGPRVCKRRLVGSHNAVGCTRMTFTGQEETYCSSERHVLQLNLPLRSNLINSGHMKAE